MVSFNIELEFKSAPLGINTDKLTDTVCYVGLIDAIKSVCQTKEFNLIEHLTEAVFQVIDQSLTQQLIADVTVITRKVAPPVSDVHGGVSFTYCSPPTKRSD